MFIGVGGMFFFSAWRIWVVVIVFLVWMIALTLLYVAAFQQDKRFENKQQAPISLGIKRTNSLKETQ